MLRAPYSTLTLGIFLFCILAFIGTAALAQTTPQNGATNTTAVPNKTPPRLQELLDKSANGDPDAQVALAESYITAYKFPELTKKLGMKVPDDLLGTVEKLCSAAAEKEPSGFTCLGDLFAAQKKPEALDWYLKAADRGDVHAMVRLGAAYSHGAVVTADMTAAKTWYRRAAETGSVEGERELGMFLWAPHGDLAEAERWLRKAADQGDIAAEGDMGSFEGREKHDAEAAFGWYLKAAEQGDPMAPSTVGVLYAVGVGVTANPAEAYFWLTLAVQYPDDPNASRDKQQLAAAAAKLDDAQLAAVQKRLREWKPKTPAAP
jgi:TPR repeat protein